MVLKIPALLCLMAIFSAVPAQERPGNERESLIGRKRDFDIRFGVRGRVNWQTARKSEARFREKDRANFIQRLHLSAEKLHTTGWTLLGPANEDISEEFYNGSSRAVTGKVLALAFDPSSKDGSFFAGSPTGGLWRYDEQRGSWTLLSTDPLWSRQCVSSLAFDPQNPRLMYVGTGDRIDTNEVGEGVMRFDGLRWSQSNLFDGQVLNGCISAVMVLPDNAHTVVVATNVGFGDDGSIYYGLIYFSKDGGGTFNRSQLPVDAAWQSLALSKNGRSLYVAGWQQMGQNQFQTVVLRNDLKTQKWTDLSDRSLMHVGSTGGAAVIASAVEDDKVYLCSGPDEKFFIVKNGTWSLLDRPNFPTGETDYGNWTQSAYDMTLAVSPSGNGETLFAGLIDLAALLNDSWRDVGRTFEKTGPRVHSDQHCIVFDPYHPGNLLIGNDGGIYPARLLTVNGQPDFVLGNPPFALTKSLPIQQFYSLAVDPLNGDNVMGGTQDNGTPRSFGSPSSFDNVDASLQSWTSAAGGDGGGCVLDPLSPQLQYATADGEVYRTTDSWKTLTGWKTGVSLVLPFRLTTEDLSPNYDEQGYPCLLASDAEGQNLYYPTKTHDGNGGHLLRITRGCSDFDSERAAAPSGENSLRYRLGAAGNDFLSSGFRFDGEPKAIQVAPGNPNIVYVGTATGHLYRTQNARDAVTEVQFAEIPSDTLHGLPILALAIDPYNSDRVFIGLGSTSPNFHRLYMADDVSLTKPVWTDFSGGELASYQLPINAILLDPVNPESLYVGTELGVYAAPRGPTSWQAISRPLGMVPVPVRALGLDYAHGRLIAATYGSGIYGLSAPTSAATVRAAAIYANHLSVTMTYPSPSDRPLLLSFNPPAPSMPTQLVISANAISAGIPTTGMQPGNYIVTIHSGTETHLLRIRI